MKTGICKWFDNKKGFGFILEQNQDGSYPEDTSQNNLFVHFSAIKMEGYKTLREGDTVSYEVTEGEKGKQAAEVSVTERAAPELNDSD